jgi:hypothetical protein
LRDSDVDSIDGDRKRITADRIPAAMAMASTEGGCGVMDLQAG